MTEIPSQLFFEPERASRTLAKLHELFITSGSSFSAEQFTQALRVQLAASPDADLALTNLLRFAEASVSREALFNDLLKYPIQFELLMKLLGYSQYFSDILVRDPELFRWLTTSDSLVDRRTMRFFSNETQRTLRIFQKPERKLDGLRRLYRREILRIGARDIFGESDLQTTTKELSHLADSLADAACTVAQQQLSERYPTVPKTPYAIIGLGKLGGAELNYSSDIDVIFVYKDEGEFKDANGKARTYHEYFNAFAEKLIVNLSQGSGEGHLYRVDTRLRPDGGAGPLARSLASYLLYYESRGELWERQMLIKARPMAGTIEFGEEFLRKLEPFVYPRTFFQNPREYIARIKARIEAAIAGEENVKLRAGGIRDIEFIVQALQLLNGGKSKEIRSRNTLDAIQKLAASNLLSNDEQRTLTEAYQLFRTIEHRLQMNLNMQTHEMPKDERSLSSLAKRVGLNSASELRRQNAELLANVRRIFENILATDASTIELSLPSVLEGNVGVDSVAAAIAKFGFRDARKAAKNVAAMTSGSALLDTKDWDGRVRDAFREIAEQVFTEISKTPSPDMTLHNLSLLAMAQKFPEQFYRQLAETSYRNLVVTICAKSPRFAKVLAKDPLLLETFATDKQALAGTRGTPLLPTKSLADLKIRGEVRAGIRFLLGLTTFDEMTAELSQLADGIFRAIVEEEFKTSKRKKVPLAILALGKYGTREINFDSDLDVLFVCDEKRGSAKDKLERVATAIVNRFSSFSEGGKLYDVDARLRPEGRSAPLVVETNAYLAYLTNRASLWERQSLTRLRFVAGERSLGRSVMNDVEKFVYETPLPRNWVDDIVAMRRKTESRSHAGRSLLDFKLGAGGMVDIEFLGQMIQLKFGTKDKALRGLATLEVIRSAPLAIPTTELAEAYTLFRKVETYIRLSLEERGTVVPDGDKAELLAKVIGVADGRALHLHLLATMKNVRWRFLNTAEMLEEEKTLNKKKDPSF